MTHTKLLNVYMQGFKDCSTGISNEGEYTAEKLKIAYKVGWNDYILGDDISSIDEQTNEMILDAIKVAICKSKLE